MRSSVHWTPVDVALRACALLAPDGGTVLDIGAGVGKLCLIGAATTRATWIGIEANREMVDAANRAARLLGVADRAVFICGDANAHDWSEADSLYFFNPFAEALYDDKIDAVPRRLEFLANIERAHQQLERLRPRARVVTYHGLGGDLPSGFDLVHREHAREDRLCLWVRRDASLLRSR